VETVWADSAYRGERVHAVTPIRVAIVTGHQANELSSFR
jgi:hypothetical protein